MAGKHVRQRRVVGAVLRVPLGDGFHTYAVTLEEADFAFVDARSDRALPASEAAARPVLFREAVHRSAYVTGRWLRVGRVELPPDLVRPVPKFIQDAIDPTRFSIYLGGEIRPAVRAECVGLPRCAVWDPEHIEDRLRDHYAGRPNKWLESLRLR